MKLNEEDDLSKRIMRCYALNHRGVMKNLIYLTNSISFDLNNHVKLMEYNHGKESDECNCLLKQQIGMFIRDIPNDSITKIAESNDPYCDFELHQCTHCYAYWILDLHVDDGLPKGWRMARHSYEFEMIEKSRNRTDH